MAILNLQKWEFDTIYGLYRFFTSYHGMCYANTVLMVPKILLKHSYNAISTDLMLTIKVSLLKKM